ncbi:MAG: IPExxxVDY family protein [Flavobacterium sp.]
MAIHKLQIDEFITVDFELIAIHSALEDYRLAYFINSALGIMLERCDAGIGIKVKDGETSFSRYDYEDPDGCAWSLIQNKDKITSRQDGPASLFGEEGMSITTNVHLLPEFKKVDYILKIENIPCNTALDEVVENLLEIKHVTTAYPVEHNKIKSKNNLIF